MKLAALFSGGKDSTYAIYLAKKLGHEVCCLLTVFPKSEESHLLHHPNVMWTSLQSKSMKIPQLQNQSLSDETETEMTIMEQILEKAKQEFHIEGMVHGGIKSKFQKDNFENLCKKLNLQTISPLWELPPEKYMHELLSSNFEFMITSVSSEGLDDKWLGKLIGGSELNELEKLAEKYQFNLNFEGGEAETFVINCPLFSSPIQITQAKKIWDGYRGRFEIVDARLNYDA